MNANSLLFILAVVVGGLLTSVYFNNLSFIGEKKIDWHALLSARAAVAREQQSVVDPHSLPPELKSRKIPEEQFKKDPEAEGRQANPASTVSQSASSLGSVTPTNQTKPGISLGQELNQVWRDGVGGAVQETLKETQEAFSRGAVAIDPLKIAPVSFARGDVGPASKTDAKAQKEQDWKAKQEPTKAKKKENFVVPSPVTAWNRTIVRKPPDRAALAALNAPAVVVCASSWNHYNHLRKMVSEFPQKGKVNGKLLPLVVYDLGLFPEETAELRSKFPWADVREFDYTKYPAFFDVRVEKGHYAWKPAIVHEVYEDYNASVLWMDSSNKFSMVRHIVDSMNQGKFVSNSAGHRVRFLCHNGTWEFLEKKLSPGTPAFKRNEIAMSMSCNGAFLGFGVKNPKVVRLLEEWYQCALVRDCIAPPNTNKVNHRQDQAVVSILAHWQGVGKHCADFAGHGVFERRTDIPPNEKQHTKAMLSLHPDMFHTHN